MNTDPDHDSEILQMGLVVSDAEAEGNGNFDEAMDSDHEGSEPPPLIDPSFNESTPQQTPSLMNSWASMTQNISLLAAACNH